LPALAAAPPEFRNIDDQPGINPADRARNSDAQCLIGRTISSSRPAAFCKSPFAASFSVCGRRYSLLAASAQRAESNKSGAKNGHGARFRLGRGNPDSHGVLVAVHVGPAVNAKGTTLFYLGRSVKD
jgi:hypothetical protein